MGPATARARSVRPLWERMFVLDANRKGAIAEAEIYAAAVRLGVPVLTPMSEHGRYDMAFEIAGRLLRVQCKWASLSDDRSFLG